MCLVSLVSRVERETLVLRELLDLPAFKEPQDQLDLQDNRDLSDPQDLPDQLGSPDPLDLLEQQASLDNRDLLVQQEQLVQLVLWVVLDRLVQWERLGQADSPDQLGRPVQLADQAHLVSVAPRVSLDLKAMQAQPEALDRPVVRESLVPLE